MGRPPSAARKHFVKVSGPMANKTHYFVRCRHCLHAHEMRSKARSLQTPSRREPDSPMPEKIIGRVENFTRHLQRYHGIVEEEQQPQPQPPQQQHPPGLTQLPQENLMESRGNERSESRVTSVGDKLEPRGPVISSPHHQRQLERLLLEFQVSLALPDTFVEHPATLRLFEFLNPACTGLLPSRRVLGGRILDACAKEYQEQSAAALRKVQDTTGGRINFLSDVWQNIAKTHLLGVHLTLFGNVYIEGMHKVDSDHHGCAIARQMENLLIKLLRDEWVIGSAITDDAGQCRRARGILALRWPNIYFGKCFAHDINNLVKAVLKTPNFYNVADQAASAVNALNASSSKWLPRVDAVIASTYEIRGGGSLALLTLCDTRWNAMQGCFASLLRVKTALKQFVVRYQTNKDLPYSVRVLGDDTFWKSLEDAERTIRPLCNASYTLQRDNNNLVDVVLCFRDIFDGFLTGSHSEELVRLVEQRWKDCEQPLFMLALFLHPEHIETAAALPRTPISSVTAACNFAVLYFKRFFPNRDPGQLRDQMSRWCNRELYESDDEQFSLSDFGGDIARFWKYARELSAGPNLPDLAIGVLSIAANTAPCERYFSEIARIHTPTRNCLKPEKANKAAAMRQAVRCRHRKREETNGEEITEEDSEGNKYVGRVIKPDERPFYRDSPSFVAVDSNSLSPIQTQGSANVTPRRLCFSLNSPTDTARCLSSTPYRPHTPGHSSAPRHSPAPSSYPLVAATHLSGNSSDAVASAVSLDESEPFDPTRTLHFLCVASRQTPAVMTSGSNFTGEDSNSVGLLESTRPHSVELMRASGLPNSALINDDILAHWRWMLDAIPDADAENSEAETSNNEDIHHTRHQNHGFNESEAMDIDQPDIELGAGEDLIRLRSRPIPLLNDPHFPQEKILPGLRGKKTTLKKLFYFPSMAS